MTAVRMDEIMRFVDRPKQEDDYTLHDVIESVHAGTGHLFSERTIRRMMRGLGVCKNAGGYYHKPDLVVLVGWIKRREQYSSYQEFLSVEGTALYQKARQHFAN